MPATSAASLAWHLRTALEQWLGDTISGGPYEDLIDELAKAVDGAELSLTAAARVDALLRATTGHDLPTCGVCDCPLPGLSHPPVGGCPDLRLHDRRHSPDGKCRYCR